MRINTDKKSLVASLTGFGLLFGSFGVVPAYGDEITPEQSISTTAGDGDDEQDEQNIEPVQEEETSTDEETGANTDTPDDESDDKEDEQTGDEEEQEEPVVEENKDDEQGKQTAAPIAQQQVPVVAGARAVEDEEEDDTAYDAYVYPEQFIALSHDGWKSYDQTSTASRYGVHYGGEISVRDFITTYKLPDRHEFIPGTGNSQMQVVPGGYLLPTGADFDKVEVRYCDDTYRSTDWITYDDIDDIIPIPETFADYEEGGEWDVAGIDFRLYCDTGKTFAEAYPEQAQKDLTYDAAANRVSGEQWISILPYPDGLSVPDDMPDNYIMVNPITTDVPLLYDYLGLDYSDMIGSKVDITYNGKTITGVVIPRTDGRLDASFDGAVAVSPYIAEYLGIPFEAREMGTGKNTYTGVSYERREIPFDFTLSLDEQGTPLKYASVYFEDMDAADDDFDADEIESVFPPSYQTWITMDKWLADANKEADYKGIWAQIDPWDDFAAPAVPGYEFVALYRSVNDKPDFLAVYKKPGEEIIPPAEEPKKEEPAPKQEEEEETPAPAKDAPLPQTSDTAPITAAILAAGLAAVACGIARREVK